MQRLLVGLFKPVLEKTKSMLLSQLALLPVPPHSLLLLGDSPRPRRRDRRGASRIAAGAWTTRLALGR